MTNTQDIQDYVNDWDNGIAIKCVNMGGLGLGYDIGIQALLIEFLRSGVEKGINVEDSEEGRKNFVAFADEVFEAIPDENSLKNVSGAMFGAARQVAYQFFAYGIHKMLSEADTQCPDRIEYWSKAQFTA